MVLRSAVAFLKNINSYYIRFLPGSYLGFCQGGCTFLADLPLPPRIWIWIRICIKILSWIRIRIRIKTMRIQALGSIVKRLMSNL